MTHANQIDRRKALTVVAAAPAAVALLEPAIAGSQEDTALLALWRKWSEKRAERDRLGAELNTVSEAAMQEYCPFWRFHDVDCNPWRAIFVDSQSAATKVVRLRSKSYDGASREARKVDASLKAARHDAVAAINKRHGLDRIERNWERSLSQLDDLADQIAETPAEGQIGVAIKLAVCMEERDHMQSPAIELVEGALAPLVGLLPTLEA